MVERKISTKQCNAEEIVKQLTKLLLGAEISLRKILVSKRLTVYFPMASIPAAAVSSILFLVRGEDIIFICVEGSYDELVNLVTNLCKN